MIELYNKEFRGIKDESEIKQAFMDSYVYDLIPENTTDCYDAANAIIKTEDGKYYDVVVYVTMVGSWQDVGDKLYTIESIDGIKYEEVQYENLVKKFNERVKSRIQSLEEELTKLRESLIEI